MPTAVRRTIGPLALRVRVSRNRRGVPDQRPPMDWARLRRQAPTFTRTAARATTGHTMIAAAVARHSDQRYRDRDPRAAMTGGKP
jgi:hypothetical protein